jgi:flagellum-specific peptidoglycan hydrolase FlgJ
MALQQVYKTDQTSSKTAGQANSGRTNDRPKETSADFPHAINDTFHRSLNNSQAVNYIKDTTGAILEQMKAQLQAGIKKVDLIVQTSGRQMGIDNLDEAGANIKSLQIGAAIALQGNKSLVQTNLEILQMLQG